ncbi:MAG TPA: sigma-70 family RNA polymerase sigma factor, partial [Spirochaetia bacterium]|nr:sigma-70 family RNA polymerase sigma factor [Spirochaetia bacterium]
MMPVREKQYHDTRTDEELARCLTEGQPDALTPLYARYAPLVFHIAAQSLDPSAAEDIVQEVFLALWRKADTYDPQRGPFRPWLLQIAHFQVLNELRRRSRRPRHDPDTSDLDDFADASDGPVETAWQSFRKEAVQAAVEKLPDAQRQALSLAFFEDLTHDQVAETLRLPLGTVKTRIRSGMRKLRFFLAPMGVAVVLIAVLVGVTARNRQGQELAQKTDRALAFVTASDVTTLHLAAASGVPARTHGAYRGRPGTAFAVITLHNMGPLEPSQTYTAWIQSNGVWVSMGSARPGADGNATIIADGQVLTSLPERVEVTLESTPSPAVP